MGKLAELQKQQGEWQRQNFGTAFKAEVGDLRCLLGIVEEVGELSHAILKDSQGIRGVNLEAEVYDAVADIGIYLIGFCNDWGINLEDCLADTWESVVSKRDWVENPLGEGETNVQAGVVPDGV